MGYRSEVSLVMTRPLFNKMLETIPQETKVMIGYAERFQKKGGSVLLYWNYIKWHDSKNISAMEKFLHNVDESEVDENGDNPYQYHFIRLGEDHDDTEEHGDYWDNPWGTAVSRSINIDSVGENFQLEAFS